MDNRKRGNTTMPNERQGQSEERNMQARDRLGRPKEADITRQIRDYLKLKSWFVFKVFQSLGSYPGVADLYAIKDGLAVWIEVKAPGGKQSTAQKEFQWQIERQGGKYVLARCVEDLAQIESESEAKGR